MITLELDNEILENTFKEELQKRLDTIQQNLTLWDMKELQKQTSMSVNTIKERFFYDDRFPKYRVGSKWYFPAKECEAFLLNWIKEQSRE